MADAGSAAATDAAAATAAPALVKAVSDEWSAPAWGGAPYTVDDYRARQLQAIEHALGSATCGRVPHELVRTIDAYLPVSAWSRWSVVCGPTSLHACWYALPQRFALTYNVSISEAEMEATSPIMELTLDVDDTRPLIDAAAGLAAAANGYKLVCDDDVDEGVAQVGHALNGHCEGYAGMMFVRNAQTLQQTGGARAQLYSSRPNFRLKVNAVTEHVRALVNDWRGSVYVCAYARHVNAKTGGNTTDTLYVIVLDDGEPQPQQPTAVPAAGSDGAAAAATAAAVTPPSSAASVALGRAMVGTASDGIRGLDADDLKAAAAAAATTAAGDGAAAVAALAAAVCGKEAMRPARRPLVPGVSRGISIRIAQHDAAPPPRQQWQQPQTLGGRSV